MTDDTFNQYPKEYRFRGRTPAELEAAFDRVCDPEDWRGPIDAWIDYADLSVTAAAIEFFTAAPVRETGSRVVNAHAQVRIQCIGYRAGPAGP